MGKRRPALVVCDLTGDDVILCQITSQVRPDPFAVPLGRGDFDQGQLAVDSLIRTNRLFTVDSSVVLYTAAKVSDSKLAEVKGRLRQLFT